MSNEFDEVKSDTSRRFQEIRKGGRTLCRTVHGISGSGHHGAIERGYVRYERGWFLVTRMKTETMTWWKLVRPAPTSEVESILKLPSGRAEEW